MENQTIQLVKQQESYKLTVTENLEKMIRFLCEKLPHNEWSGTIFYEVEGSFKDKNLNIICKDFFLQDVGEATFTEFQNDVDLAGYIAEHELWDCNIGLMHSHNTMATFFSGTDISTLREQGEKRNHFLSLIVNNAGQYTANITRKVKCTSTGNSIKSYNTFNDVTINDESSQFESESFYIEYYPLDITVEQVPEREKSELELRLEEVKKSATSYINKGKIPLYNSYLEKKSSSFGLHNQSLYPTSPSENNIKKESSFPPFQEKEKHTQLTLFNDEDYITKPKNETLEYGVNEEIPYGKVHLKKELHEGTLKQIVTGDIFSIYKQNIDLDKWKSNMDKLYEKRFSDTENDNFGYWIDTLIEFLELEIKDDELIKYGRDFVDAVWAYDLIEELKTFPKSKCVDTIMESLARWLI